MTASLHEPARHSKRNHAVPRAALLTFLILALVAAGAGVVVRVARADAPPALTDTPVVVTGEGTAFRLGARATASAGAARFAITSTRVPASARLTLDPAGAAPARAVAVTLSSGTTEVVLRGLRAGTARWTLGADGAAPLRGRLTIPGKGTPKPSPAAVPGVLPSVTSPSTPDRALPGTPRAPQPVAPGSTAPSTPSAAPAPSLPSPTSKPTPKPTPTPRPTGPAAPYDPDDH